MDLTWSKGFGGNLIGSKSRVVISVEKMGVTIASITTFREKIWKFFFVTVSIYDENWLGVFDIAFFGHEKSLG